MRTALDTNILLAVWGGGETGADVVGLLGAWQREGPLVISAPVYVELCAHPLASQTFVDQYLERRRIDIDYEFGLEVWRSAAAASEAIAKRSQSPRRLADLLIGAHATLCADRLATLDRERYATLYPRLVLVPDPSDVLR